MARSSPVAPGVSSDRGASLRLRMNCEFWTVTKPPLVKAYGRPRMRRQALHVKA